MAFEKAWIAERARQQITTAMLGAAKIPNLGYENRDGSPLAIDTDYLAKKPTFIVEKAVKGMLPRTRLGAALLRNLKVYAGTEHPHAAQNPKTIKLNEIK